MKWGHSTAMGNNSLCSQFCMAAGMMCEMWGGEAWPGCMGTGVGCGMETRCSVAQVRGVAQARDEGVSEVWADVCTQARCSRDTRRWV